MNGVRILFENTDGSNGFDDDPAFVSQSQAVTLSNALQITENHILVAQIGQFDSQAEIGRPANAAFPEGSAASSSDTEYELYHAGGDIENASDQASILFIAKLTGNFSLEAEDVYIFAFGDPTWTKTVTWYGKP